MTHRPEPEAAVCPVEATWAFIVVTWQLMGRQAPYMHVCPVMTLRGDATTADQDGGDVKRKWSYGVDDVRAERIMGEWRLHLPVCFSSHRPCFCSHHFSVVESCSIIELFPLFLASQHYLHDVTVVKSKSSSKKGKSPGISWLGPSADVETGGRRIWTGAHGYNLIVCCTWLVTKAVCSRAVQSSSFFPRTWPRALGIQAESGASLSDSGREAEVTPREIEVGRNEGG